MAIRAAAQQQHSHNVAADDHPVGTGKGSDDDGIYQRDGHAQGIDNQRGKEFAHYQGNQVNRGGQQRLVCFVFAILTEQPHGENRDKQHNDGKHTIKDIAQAGGVAVKHSEEEIAGEHIKDSQIDIADGGCRNRPESSRFKMANIKRYLRFQNRQR